MGVRRTILVFRHVESAKQHDSLFPIVASFRDERRMRIQQLPATDVKSEPGGEGDERTRRSRR